MSEYLTWEVIVIKSLTCFRRWARLSNGYWVALANGDYVSWTGSIPQC